MLARIPRLSRVHGTFAAVVRRFSIAPRDPVDEISRRFFSSCTKASRRRSSDATPPLSLPRPLPRRRLLTTSATYCWRARQTPQPRHSAGPTLQTGGCSARPLCTAIRTECLRVFDFAAGEQKRRRDAPDRAASRTVLFFVSIAWWWISDGG